MSSVTGDYSYRGSNTIGGTTKTGNTYNAVFTDKQKDEVSVDDFLQLMVAQLRNQDFMNPVDDTQYVTQLAQFASMQGMQEMAERSKASYAISLVGKNVTVARYTLSGGIEKATGPVEKVSLVDNSYQLTVQGKTYSLEQVMEVNQIKETTNDDTDKVDPTKLAITVSDVTANSANISWPQPDLDEEKLDELGYTVYYSTVSDMDSVEEIEKNGIRVGQAERERLTFETLEGLQPDTQYYVNVIVIDGSGIKAAYQKSQFHTKEE